jgi:hypothetical protein
VRWLLALALLGVAGAAPRFSHRVHAGQDCVACHANAAASVRAAERARPPASACAGCHAAGTVEVPVAPAPPASILFGHRPHLARGIGCTRCHPGDEPAMPTMDTCTSCHDGRAAPGRCDTCHPALPDGRLRTTLPEGRLLPTGRVGGLLDHRGDVVRQHGPAARADRDGCADCHAEADCVRCHASTLRPVEIHAGDYILTHPPEARRDDPHCGACHRTQTFCIDCHQRSGIGTVPGEPGFFGASSARARRFHPPGWVDFARGAPGSQQHAWEARRNLRACVGCHEESTCVACHSPGATAVLRASPHPPGFSRYCGRTREANERGCLTCHGTREALDRACAR